MKSRTYIKLPVPIKAVSSGRVVRVVNVGIGGCGVEFDAETAGLLHEYELSEMMPMVFWLDAIERRARRSGRLIDLPFPLICEGRVEELSFVSLTGVSPSGIWFSYDEAGDTTQVRLADVTVLETTEEYVAELKGLTVGRVARSTRKSRSTYDDRPAQQGRDVTKSHRMPPGFCPHQG